MARVVDKIRSLIDLAISAGTSDEARNAALQAVRLIRKHELEVVSKVAAEVLEKIQTMPHGKEILTQLLNATEEGKGASPNADHLKETIIRAGGRAIGDVASTLLGNVLRKR